MSQAAQQLAEFHRHIDQIGPGHPSMDQHAGRVDLRKRLLRDELDELDEALDAADLAGIAHETADLVYAAYGLAHTYGFDLDAVLAEIHRANMTKTIVVDGKAIKGGGYRPPDVAAVLAKQTADYERRKLERYPHCRPGWLGEYQPYPCCRCGRDVDGADPHVCIGAELPPRETQ